MVAVFSPIKMLFPCISHMEQSVFSLQTQFFRVGEIHGKTTQNGNPGATLSRNPRLQNMTGWWFQPTPLKNMTKSVGMMTFPICGKYIKNVPNHQLYEN